MVTIRSEIVINVPIEVCFDCARDLVVHTEAEKHRGERIVGSKKCGLLEPGEQVTFEAVHFGIRQRLTSKIVQMERPSIFVDEMQKGAFKSLRHTHYFEEIGAGTLMIDTLEFAAPLAILGRFAELAVLRSYMQHFLEDHQRNFKKIVE